MMIAVAVVSLLAAISPGPDFFIVLRNSLTYSRKAGLLTALGVSFALLIHLSYTLVGIGVVIAESPFLYHLVKYTGVVYLFYLGLTGLLSSFKKQSSMNLEYTTSTMQISAPKALLQGFLTNLLNPKCALFFISLFSQFIDADTPMATRIEYAAINWSVSLGWFLLLAYMVTGKYLMGRIDRFRLYIDRTMGGALMMLSMKMLLA